MYVARLLIKFTKTNRAKFISHLDTMRTLHRAFRRAALPISYSQGFNPHASISVAAPLSLGIESIAEYADVDISGEFDCDTMKTALNEALPSDIRILDIIKIVGKAPAAMAAVAFARYSIRLDLEDEQINGETIIQNIMGQTELLRMKRTKSGEKLVDIKPLIDNIIVENQSNNSITFEGVLASGSNGSLGVDMLTALLKEFSEGKISDHPFVRRVEIYTKQDDKKIPLLRYFAGK